MQRFIVYEQSHFSNPLRSKQLSKGGAELRAVASHQCGPGNMGWFFPLLQEVFLRVLRFSPVLKNQNFQIPIPPAIRQAKNNSDYVDVPPLNLYLFIYFIIIFHLVSLLNPAVLAVLHEARGLPSPQASLFRTAYEFRVTRAERVFPFQSRLRHRMF